VKYKTISILFLMGLSILTIENAFSQVKISSGGGNPDSSAGLDVDYNNKGFLPPRLTTVQRDAVTAPATGLTIYNLTTNCLNFYDGVGWRESCGTATYVLISTLNCSGVLNTGTLTSGIAASGVTFQLSYTGGNGASFNSQSVSSTGVSGLTASLSSGTLANGSGNLLYNITGTPLSSGTAIFTVSIGGQTCTISRLVGTPFTCGTSSVQFTYNSQSVTYGTVVGVNGRCWLNRNLGASQAATSTSDYLAYGDLFQWGRNADGHQRMNWVNSSTGTPVSGITSVLSSNDQPGTNMFIATSSSPNDWRSPQNASLWQGTQGINNPCPSGWRIPTQPELDAERAAWSSQNPAGAYASSLRLIMSGIRISDGTVIPPNSGMYWSSSTDGTAARFLYFDSSGNVSWYTDNRSRAHSVRCIKD